VNCTAYQAINQLISCISDKRSRLLFFDTETYVELYFYISVLSKIIDVLLD